MTFSDTRDPDQQPYFNVNAIFRRNRRMGARVVGRNILIIMKIKQRDGVPDHVLRRLNGSILIR